jgi:hypothetical protein
MTKLIKNRPYKEAEYAKFIKLIEVGNQETWLMVAQALGVDPETITKWKKTPAAQAALAKGITRAVSEMEKAGAKDWRMWESRLRMLGVNPATKIESEEKVEVTHVNKILVAYGIKEDGKLREPLTGQIAALKKIASGE